MYRIHDQLELKSGYQSIDCKSPFRVTEGCGIVNLYYCPHKTDQEMEAARLRSGGPESQVHPPATIWGSLSCEILTGRRTKQNIFFLAMF
jgi:hypothetical protein